MAVVITDASPREWRLVLLRSELPRNAKLVGLAVEAFIQNDRGGQVNPWPSDYHFGAEVAVMAGLSYATYRRWFLLLKEEGWL